MSNDIQKGALFDSGGRLVAGPQPGPDELNLPSGVQALIETRLNAGLDQIRESNRADLSLLAAEQGNRWRTIALWSFLTALLAIRWNIFSWFIAPEYIEGWVRDHVKERMTEPTLMKAADEAIRSKMGRYVDDQIASLKDQADIVSNEIGTLRESLASAQEDLKQDQQTLRSQVQIQELLVSAKSGAWSAYLELIARAGAETAGSPAAITALRDIEMHFDMDRGQLSARVLVDSITQQSVSYSPDELVGLLMHQDAGMRESAVNMLSKQGTEKTLYYLCSLLQQEQDTRVIARTTLALEKLGKSRLRPLDRDSALAWCSNNREASTLDVLAPYFAVKAALDATGWNGDVVDPRVNIDQLITWLDDTIRTEPKALHARCIKAALLTSQGRFAEADIAFEEVAAQDSRYKWLLLWRTVAHLKQAKRDAAIETMNTLLEVAPGTALAAEQIPTLRDLRAEPSVNWQKTKASPAGRTTTPE